MDGAGKGFLPTLQLFLTKREQVERLERHWEKHAPSPVRVCLNLQDWADESLASLT